MQIKTAIIGLGIMGRRMLEHMQRHPNFSVAAIWDLDSYASRAAQEIAPPAWPAASAKDAMTAADLVYLACPPIPRTAYTLEAAAKGKAVFIEKPLGIDIEQSRDLVKQLILFNVPAAVNFTQAAGFALTDITAAMHAGELGQLMGIDIFVSYANWPRAWQQSADWLRFREEGGMTREVISHFLFLSERILGPLTLVWAETEYPEYNSLCETHVTARLVNTSGVAVNLIGSVGGVQPDRQEVTIKGSKSSRRILDFYHDSISFGADFVPVRESPEYPRAVSLKAQLDDLVLMMAGNPNRLATLQEALRVQYLIESILARGQKI